MSTSEAEAARVAALACPDWCVDHEITVDTAAMRAIHYHQSEILEVESEWGFVTEVRLQQPVPYQGEVQQPWVLIEDEAITEEEIRAGMELLERAANSAKPRSRRFRFGKRR